MRTNGLDFTITNYTIASIVEEGFSVADADGHVYQTVPDLAVSQEEYNATFEQLPGMTVDSIEKKVAPTPSACVEKIIPGN